MIESTSDDAQMLRSIYLRTLERCAPASMLRSALETGRVSFPDRFGAVVAVGKCAAPLAAAVVELAGVRTGLVIHPAGYGDDVILPESIERLTGSHPIPSVASRVAAKRAIEFVSRQAQPVLFLISGGASACMEEGLSPHVTFEALMRVTDLLVRSGLPIDAINTVRRHLSAVKGGRLGALAPSGSHTLVYSDVPPGRPELVGSGPTAHDPTSLADAAAILSSLDADIATELADALLAGLIPETSQEPPTTLEVIADSDAMVEAAAEECRGRGLEVRTGSSLDGDVDAVAIRLSREAAELHREEILIAAGEPTVEVRGSGTGGRCTELAARFVLASDESGMCEACGLFGSSDGRDGSSPAAAVIARAAQTRRLDPRRAAEAFARSASYELVADVGEPIMMKPTGNNLRDIALLLRRR